MDDESTTDDGATRPDADGMEFRPAISSDLKVMEGGVFEPRRLGLRERWDARAAAAGPGPRGVTRASGSGSG